MPIKNDTAAKDAKHEEKMIDVKVRFWTDDIAENGKIIPEHALTAGVVRMERNEAHGITPAAPIPFNSLFDLGAAIEKALLGHGVTLHTSRKTRRYVAQE